MFNDIKQVLKAVEESKSKIDTHLNELNRQRETKLFYNRTLSDDDYDYSDNYVDASLSKLKIEAEEQRRTRKLVDGCISAITTDVQRIVEQKLIDESRHVKLIAERDTSTTSSNFNSNSKNTRIKKNLSQFPLRIASKQPIDKQTVSQTKKYLNKIYGPTFLTQLKREEDEKKAAEREELLLKQREMEKLKRQNQINKNILTKTKPKPIKQSQLPIKPQPQPSPPPPIQPTLSSSSSVTAFLTIPFKSFTQRSRSTSREKPDVTIKQNNNNNNNNIGLVNIITQSSSSKNETAKELKRQVKNEI